MLLYLWCRPEAVALTQSLAWELPYATGVALKSKKKKKKEEEVCPPWMLRETQKFPTKEMGTLMYKAVWAKGISNVPHCICTQLKIHQTKLYTVVTYVPVTTFKN